MSNKIPFSAKSSVIRQFPKGHKTPWREKEMDDAVAPGKNVQRAGMVGMTLILQGSTLNEGPEPCNLAKV